MYKIIKKITVWKVRKNYYNIAKNEISKFEFQGYKNNSRLLKCLVLNNASYYILNINVELLANSHKNYKLISINVSSHINDYREWKNHKDLKEFEVC